MMNPGHGFVALPWEWPPVPNVDVLDALGKQWITVNRLLAQGQVAGWDAPTRLAGWRLKDLVAHLALGAEHVRAMVTTHPAAVTGQTSLDWYTGSAGHAPDIDRQARAVAEAASPPALIARFEAATVTARQELRRVGPDRILGGASSGITALDYALTRIVEAVVHGFDLCAVFGPARVVAPEAQRVCAAVLAGVLSRRIGRQPDGWITVRDDVIRLGDCAAGVALPLPEWIELASGRLVSDRIADDFWCKELPVLR